MESQASVRHGWQLDKTINAGHLVSVLLVAVSVFAWVNKVDNRVEKNKQEIVFVKQEQTRMIKEFATMESRIESVRIEIKSDLKDINSKLDRLIEKHPLGYPSHKG